MSSSPLPPWNEGGLLDPGAHPTDLDGIYERFVVDAPEREARELLFGCFENFLQLAIPLVGPSTLWVNGGFAMKKSDAPSDVDVVIFPDEIDRISLFNTDDRSRVLHFLTLQNIIVGSPIMGGLSRLQPMSGALDAFISGPEEQHYWYETWSKVKRNGVMSPDEIKGFAEVRM